MDSFTFLFEKLNLRCTEKKKKRTNKNWNNRGTSELIFQFVIRQDVQYFAINPCVVIYMYIKNYQLAIVIVGTVKRDKRDSVYSIVPNDPIRFAELSHACAFTIRARVSRCSLLAMSMAYPLACYWHEQVRPENSSTLVPHGWNWTIFDPFGIISRKNEKELDIIISFIRVSRFF